MGMLGINANSLGNTLFVAKKLVALHMLLFDVAVLSMLQQIFYNHNIRLERGCSQLEIACQPNKFGSIDALNR